MPSGPLQLLNAATTATADYTLGGQASGFSVLGRTSAGGPGLEEAFADPEDPSDDDDEPLVPDADPPRPNDDRQRSLEGEGASERPGIARPDVERVLG